MNYSIQTRGALESMEIFGQNSNKWDHLDCGWVIFICVTSVIIYVLRSLASSLTCGFLKLYESFSFGWVIFIWVMDVLMLQQFMDFLLSCIYYQWKVEISLWNEKQ